MTINFNKLAVAFAAALISAAASAATSGGATMGVTASIAEECSIGNTVTLAFGQLSMFVNGANSTAPSASIGGGTFDAICTAGTTTPKLTFTSANTSESDFRLKGADGTYIVYTLAVSGGPAIVYSQPTAFDGFTDIADGNSKSLAITGSIAATERNGKPKQAYTDTITITSTYGI